MLYLKKLGNTLKYVLKLKIFGYYPNLRMIIFCLSLQNLYQLRLHKLDEDGQ